MYLPPLPTGVDADVLEPREPLATDTVSHAHFRPCSLPPVLPTGLPLRFTALVSRSIAATTGEWRRKELESGRQCPVPATVGLEWMQIGERMPSFAHWWRPTPIFCIHMCSPLEHKTVSQASQIWHGSPFASTAGHSLNAQEGPVREKKPRKNALKGREGIDERHACNREFCYPLPLFSSSFPCCYNEL
jgi:hypothetical protein